MKHPIYGESLFFNVYVNVKKNNKYAKLGRPLYYSLYWKLSDCEKTSWIYKPSYCATFGMQQYAKNILLHAADNHKWKFFQCNMLEQTFLDLHFSLNITLEEFLSFSRIVESFVIFNIRFYSNRMSRTAI